MKLNLLVAPDFAPERFAGWHMFNTVLQKRADFATHLLTPATATEQSNLINQGNVDMIYANPFDAAVLIREKAYQVVARPVGKPDEMVIASGINGTVKTLADLQPGCRIAMADNRDVKLIGLRLLEAVDLTESDIQWHITENYQAAVRATIKGEAEAAFFMAEVYHSLSRLTLSQLQVLIASDLNDISHVLLVKDSFTDKAAFTQALLSLHTDEDGKTLLTELGLPNGFEAMSEEDGEFMIDLMETLLD